MILKPVCFSLILFTALLLSPHTLAAFSPIGFSFTSEGEVGQFPHKDWSVYGVRFSAIEGTHRQVVGLDIGVLSQTTELSSGVQISVLNLNQKRTFVFGLQLGAIANNNRGPMSGFGLQMSLLSNYNKGKGHFVGVQMAASNVSHNNVYGMQLGLYNKARRVVGFQVGVMNYCGNLHGMQIGLLNVCKSCLIGIMPGINIGFF